MDNKRPVSVLIDGDMAMREAIQKVFPNAKHRLCNWHMPKKAKRNVRVDGFEGHFKHLMDLDANEVVFEEAWSKMVRKYGLQNKKWVSDTYNNKGMWAQSYLRGHFFTGMKSSQRCEEADAEAKTDNSDPCLTTTLQPREKHAATIFTRRLFLIHMISVMKCEHMTKILPSCVMHRWTKQARKVGEQHCQAQFSSTLTQETRFGVLCSSFTEMCYYASQTSEGFEEARNAFFTMTCRMKQLCMAKGTNVDEGKSSLPPFGVGDSKVVNTKGNTGGSYMAKPRKPRRCQCYRVVSHTRRTCPQNDHKTGQRPRNNIRPCKTHPVKRRLFVTNVDTSPVQLSKDVNDLRSCDAQVVQNSAFIDADTSLGVAMGNSCYDRADKRYAYTLKVASVMTVWNNVQPDYAANMWNEALNKRLGTKGLDLPEILVEAERRGSSFDELLTIPEQDNWIYTDGKSTSCVVFILEMYKEAGLFDPIANSIQVTEFTVASVMTVWNNVQFDYAANRWNEALNKRLGTKGLDLPEILVEAERRVEQHDWIYSDGKFTSCVVFILEMYKEAGLFDPIAYSIQVTEFTYKRCLHKFFENNSSRLPKWCNDADTVKLPFCQIRGKYRMELPGYNTMDPYPHMSERYPSLPPKYSRPKDC
ncbi:unnamed protein product [Camellia sinensis]